MTTATAPAAPPAANSTAAASAAPAAAPAPAVEAGPQTTLKTSARCSGIALHTGVRAHLTLKPAPANHGIQITRVDLPDRPTVPALAAQVTDVRRATTLGAGRAAVHTVEHVLAALYAAGVDNALLEMDGPEPPVMDGSAAPFVELVAAAGSVGLDAPRRVYRVDRLFYHEDRDTRVLLLPGPEYRICCTVQFGGSLLDTQYRSQAITAASFAAELAPARTFCLYHEIEPLMVAGLIRGGSLDNANIIKDGAIICKERLRFADELVRHKMLDVVGDLSLVGCRLIGQVIAIKPGHPANVALARQVAAHLASR